MLDAPINDFQLDENQCFLCGIQMDRPTQEHVFPRWLQRRHLLWTKRIGLLNDTGLQYGKLLIPCCATCNNGALSDLESIIAPAATSGYDRFASLDEHLIYLWVGKLFYGILRKELILPLDRANPESGTILTPEILKSFTSLHLFLQGIRGRHVFRGTPPYSVLICNLHDLGDDRNFCFRDAFMPMTAAIRMGEIGVIVAFEDAGWAASNYGRYIADVNGRKLHPIQFDELYAKVTYQCSLMTGPMKYVTQQSAATMQTEVFGAGYVRPWSQAAFSEVLRAHLAGWTIRMKKDSDWFVPPDLVPTWMKSPSGELLIMPLPEWEHADHKL